MPRKAPRPPETDELEITDRDFVMARLAAGRTAAHDACLAIDEALGLFINPDQDPKGKERKECITTALEALGVATRAMEIAEENAGEYDPKEGEPGDEEEEEDEEDEDDDDDDDDDEDDAE